MITLGDRFGVCPTTTQSKLKYKYNYKILDWKDAGFKNESILKTDQVLMVTLDMIYKRGGKLTKRDMLNALAKFSEAHADKTSEGQRRMESFVVRALKNFGKY